MISAMKCSFVFCHELHEFSLIFFFSSLPRITRIFTNFFFFRVNSCNSWLTLSPQFFFSCGSHLWDSGKSHPYLDEMFIFCQHLLDTPFVHNGYRGEVSERDGRLVLESLPQFPGCRETVWRHPLNPQLTQNCRSQNALYKTHCLLKDLTAKQQGDDLVQNVVTGVNWNPIAAKLLLNALHFRVARLSAMSKRHPSPSIYKDGLMIHYTPFLSP